MLQEKKASDYEIKIQRENKVEIVFFLDFLHIRFSIL